MPSSRRTARSGMDIDEIRRRRRALKLKIYTIDGEGASNSPKDWAEREAAAKELEKLTADLRRLKKKKGGSKTRRR